MNSFIRFASGKKEEKEEPKEAEVGAEVGNGTERWFSFFSNLQPMTYLITFFGAIYYYYIQICNTEAAQGLSFTLLQNEGGTK